MEPKRPRILGRADRPARALARERERSAFRPAVAGRGTNHQDCDIPAPCRREAARIAAPSELRVRQRHRIGEVDTRNARNENSFRTSSSHASMAGRHGGDTRRNSRSSKTSTWQGHRMISSRSSTAENARSGISSINRCHHANPKRLVLEKQGLRWWPAVQADLVAPACRRE